MLRIDISIIRRAGASGVVHGTWSPLDLGAKLKGWWHADDTANGLQTSWADRIAAATVTASGVNRPISGLTGGYRWITFDGTDDYMRGSTAVLGLPLDATEGEVWCLCSQDTPGATSSTKTVFAYGAASGQQIRRVVRTGVAGVSRFQVNNVTATTHVDTGFVFDNVAVVGAIFTATVNGGRINGNDTVPASTAHAGTMATAATSVTIGASNASTPAAFWTGLQRHNMATLILTANEREKLEAWLAWDVARADLLPSGHPYRNVRP